MADSLRLLFELDVDSRSGVAGLLRWRKEITATVDAARRAISQPLILPPVKTSATGGRGGGQADAHVREFRRIEAEAAKSAKIQEREQARLQRAVESLQRQRSAALIRLFKEEEKAAIASARAQERAAREIARGSALLPQFQQRLNSIGAAALRVGGGLRSMGASMAILVSGPLVALGRVAGQSAADIDAIRNRLIATEGSLEAANARLTQLRALADSTIGVTRKTALDTFAVLSTLGEITEETINNQIRAFGRLNAAFTIDDQQLFFRNLLQIFQQGFEIKDIKEALGRVPIFNQLLESAFGTSDPDKLRQLKAAGKLTLDTFLAGLGTSVETNPVLGRIQESFTVRFAKTFERIRDSLEPLGLAILGPLERIVNFLEPIIVRITAAFARLPEGIQIAIVALGIFIAALGPILFVLGGIASGVGAIATAVSALLPVLASIGLPAIAAVIAGIVVVIGEWVVILAALGLAWRTNFLNIRQLVSDAATAVVESFTRIRTIVTEAIERILPTLQSITTKVLGIVTAAWNKYGDDVVRVVGAAFRFISRIIEDTLATFANFVDLIAKLIDGDFRGAWAAFARIHVTALQAFDDFLNKMIAAAARAFLRLHVIIVREAARIALTAQLLAAAFVAALTTALVKADKVVRDALIDMFVNAVAGMDLTTVGAIAAAKFLDAFKKAAAKPVRFEDVGEFAVAGSVPAALPVQKRPTTTTLTGAGGAGKGADAETRRRIRLLELEAERAEAIAQQRIAAENIHFEQRRTSLKDFTAFQIREEEIVLEKKRAVFAAERAEAEKLTKGRDLALGEIRLKELQAELDFAISRNQLLANQEQQEVQSARDHRQALLDIQNENDSKQLELIDSYVERYLLSFEEAEERRLEIEDNARRRRRGELETQLSEAGQNVEEQQRIKDAIAKLDAESATAREQSENRKRAAIRATIEVENDYFQNLQDVTIRTAQLLRDAADIELGGLIRRFGDRRVFRLEQLRLEREANEEEHQERLRQIAQEKQDAEKRLEGVRDAEEKLLQLRRFYRALEKAENQRRATEREDEERKEAEERDPFTPLRKRLDEFVFAINSTNNSIAESLANVSQQVNSVLDNMEDALQQGIVAWILYGESLGKALQKALAQQLAVLSAEFAIQALKHAAYALGSLAFGNFASAAKHAAAAAAFTAAAAATGIAARALSKSSGLYNQGKSNTAATAVGGGAQPQNREFQYGGTVVEPSSTASREGSAAPRTPGMFGVVADLVQAVKRGQQENAALAAKLDGTLSRIGSLPAGEVVTIGAADASLAIGAAVIQHSKENSDFNRDMATNMGL